MRYRETHWKENLCNSRGSMLWSLFDRNNNKEAKVHARGSRYQSATPCSYFLNQASFRQTSLVSTNESRLDEQSRFDERVSFRRTSLVSTSESRFDERVSFRRASLVSTNESRFDERVSFRRTSLVSTNESLLEQTSLVENRLSSDSRIVTIKNRVVSQKPWVIPPIRTSV